METRKKLRFIIKTEKPITESMYNLTMESLERFQKGEIDILILKDFIKVSVFDENNECIMTL